MHKYIKESSVMVNISNKIIQAYSDQTVGLNQLLQTSLHDAFIIQI